MVPNSLFISVVLGLAAVFVSTLGLVTKVIGDRISDLSTAMTTRFNSVDMRLNSVEGAVRDMGERLTVLETDFRNR